MKNTHPKNATMEMVSQMAGVSITTVSHVINKTRHVSKETKDAVLLAVKALNYQFPKPCKLNGNGKNTHIGVILADAREDFYSGVIKNIELVAADYGISIIFCDSGANREKEEENIAMMLKRNAGGLLIAPVDAENFPEPLKNASVPVVLIDRQYEFHNFLFVGINNFQSSYAGTNYLIKKGAGNIGFISYKGAVYTCMQRSLGYKSAYMEFGGRPHIISLSYHKEDSFPIIKNFIIEFRLDGIFCATSSLCCEAIEVLDTMEPEIQKKMKIICYDDNRWLDYLKYPVSVISQPIAEICSTAVDSLINMIEQPVSRPKVKQEMLFNTSLIDRIR